MRQLFESNYCCNYSDLALSEDEQKVYIDAAIPGVKSEDIDVTLDQQRRTLKIRAQSKIKRDNAFYHLKGVDRFFYEIPLSNIVDVTRPIEANCKDGILTVELLKTKTPEPLKIEVRVA